MSTNKVHSRGQVPFAWENKPGIPKEDTCRGHHDDNGRRGGKPPYLQPESGRASPVDLKNIPLPPCAFQSPKWTSVSKRDAYKEEDDPFLIAYKKCTNVVTPTTTSRRLLKKKNGSASALSCKHSCSVSDDSIVRISHLSIPRPTKEVIGSLFKFDD